MANMHSGSATPVSFPNCPHIQSSHIPGTLDSLKHKSRLYSYAFIVSPPPGASRHLSRGASKEHHPKSLNLTVLFLSQFIIFTSFGFLFFGFGFFSLRSKSIGGISSDFSSFLPPLIGIMLLIPSI